MFDPSSFVDPTPLAQANASRDVLPRGGSNINILDDIGAEIKRRIIAVNFCLRGLRAFLKQKLIKRHTKITLHKTIIRLVLTYGSETLTKSQVEQQPSLNERFLDVSLVL
ncbi:hypothetical protein TNCV_4882411 [Trichonephila clavipes]|nr:hypothetical protein TNCV_4882411 [Trichonephila clavipes]